MTRIHLRPAIWCLCAALLWAGIVAPALAAQSRAERDGLEMTAVDVTRHPSVAFTISLPATAVTRELGTDAFEVVENGSRRPFSIQRVPGDQLAVLLLIDTSGSMVGTPLAAAKAAAEQFVGRLPAEVQVAILGFGDQPGLAADFTTDRMRQRQAITSLRASGETALHDALTAAAELLPMDQRVDRAVILLSDGGDTVSDTNLDDAVAAVRSAGVTVHAVELATPESDRTSLQRLVEETGGSLTSTTEPEALAELYTSIASELVNRYRITYESAAHGRTDLTVTLEHDGTTTSVTRKLSLPSAAALPGHRGPVSFILDAGWASEPWVVPAGTAAIFTSFALFLLPLLRPRSRPSMLDHDLPGGPLQRLGYLPGFHVVADRLIRLVDRRIEGERRRRLSRSLERAGVALRPGEAIVLLIAAMLIVGGVTSLIVGRVAAIITALGVALAAKAWLGHLERHRRDAFADQLADTLQLLSGSLRAGYGIVQGLDTVASEAADPTAEEFRRVLVEIRIGHDLDAAMEELAQRMQLQDFNWVVQAIQIHREVGGDLAEVLDNVAGTVREREYVRGQVRALSAEGRISAWILTALPFLVALLLNLMKPGYFAEMFQVPLGWVLLTIGGVLLLAGAFWIRRLVRFDF